MAVGTTAATFGGGLSFGEPGEIARLENGGVGGGGDVVLEVVVTGKTVFVDEPVDVGAAGAAEAGFAHARVEERGAAVAAGAGFARAVPGSGF